MSVLSMTKCDFCQMFFVSSEDEEELCPSCVEKDLEKVKFCLCKQQDDGREYVQCGCCANWYHLDCVGLTAAPIDEFRCPKCKKKKQKS